MNTKLLPPFLTSALFAAMPTAAAAQSFVNGNFNVGGGWTVVNTINGTGAPGTITSIDIDGPGPLGSSNAATFQAGQAASEPGVPRGLEMTQSLSLAAGFQYTVDFDWSAQRFSGPNVLDAGRFALIVGGTVIVQDSAPSAGPTLPRYGHVTGTFTRTVTGPVSVGIRITRVFQPHTDLWQYVDNVTLHVDGPVSTSLGALPVGLTVANDTLAPGQVRWYSFTIPAVASPAYLDTDTEGSALSPSNDTEVGLYNSAGSLVATDDNDGSGSLSQLTFGNTSPRPPVGSGAEYNGRDGNLAAGTYFLAVAGADSTFGSSGWNVVSNSTHTGNVRVNLVLGNDVPTGACCRSTCSILTYGACATAGGVYRGDGSTCAAANCAPPYAEVGDAGELPATAQDVTGFGTLFGITGSLSSNDADMYRISICDAANFRASTVGQAAFDTQLFVFRNDGTGVSFNDDNVGGSTFQSTITNQFVAPAGNGTYLLAISQFNKKPLGASTAGLVWQGAPSRSERAPDGPAAAEPVGSWTTLTGTGGAYGISLTGACYLSGGCYPNCDGSTGTPRLTSNDFQCFLNKFAAGDPYANCDASTGTPTLTANDFQCFLNSFAAGCS